MIIGKYFSFVSSAGGCGKTRQGKYYWREGAYNSSPFNTCAEAQHDWDKKYGKLNITKHPDSTANGGGLSSKQPYVVPYKSAPPTGGTSANSVAKAQGKINASGGVYSPNPTGTSAPANATVSNMDKKLSASGSATLGLGAGASGAFNYIKDTADDVASAILPDVIEDKLPAGFPLWVLPIGAVGVLTLLLITRRR